MLGQCNGFIGEIASDFDAEEPMCRSKVSNLVLLVYLFFKPTNQLPRTSSYHAVINMNCENDDVSPDFPEKYSMIRLCPSKPQLVECLAKGLIPVPCSLLQPMQCLQQLPHPHSTIFCLMTDRLLKVNISFSPRKVSKYAELDLNVSMGQPLRVASARRSRNEASLA